MAQESKTAQGSNASKLERAVSILKSRLEDEAGVLDTLLGEAIRGRPQQELWKLLHEAAVRDDMLPELAFAYEQLARSKRLKSASGAVQAEVLMHAATFFVEVFGDADGASEVLERVLAAAPGHVDAFAHLERLLIAAQNWLALAELYVKSSEHRSDTREQVALLRRAAELVDRMPGEVERAINVYERILQIDPTQRRFRRTLEARYLLAGRTEDAANFLEQVLGATPPPDEDEAFAMRTRLMVLYAGELGQVLRSLPHVEELLRRDPAHEQARLVAQRLLEHEDSAMRAAAVLAEVYERLGSAPEAAAMLAIQLEHLKGHERGEVQRRLAILRQDGLGDPAGAQPLLESLMLADPGDEEIRQRFRAVSAALDRRLDAARSLARAAGVTKDVAVRARIGAELGEVLVEAGDVKRARAVYQEVIDRGGDDRAVLAAARELCTLYGLARESKSLALVLELLTRIEPDPSARLAAAEKLARLLESELGDTQGAIAAWRPLLGTELDGQALTALEALYDKVGAREELADVLDRRAKVAAGPAARVLAFRAAEMRAAARPPEALETWRSLLSAHGPSREIFARLLPLLEQDKRWDELATALAQDASLAPAAERTALFARLAEVRQQLGDDAGAIEAHRDVLRAEPKNEQSRKALEHLLTKSEHRLAAAEVLEPIYRGENAAAALCKVLEVKAESHPELSSRLNAYEQAVVLLERELDEPRRALELCASALREAAQGDAKKVTAWLERFEKLAHPLTKAGSLEPRHRAAMMVQSLSDRDIDARPLARLARAAADALEAVGDVDRALILYRRVQAYDPSAELEKRIKKLVLEQKSPEERLTTHQTALEQAADPGRRRDLLHSIAAVYQDELNDIPQAIAHWQLALDDDGNDAVALEGMAKACTQAGDDRGRWNAQRQLAIVRQDVMRDVAGALSLLEKLVLAHPEDAELRRRLRAAAAAQNRRSDAVRTLTQAEAATDDAALKAQLGCELGETLVEAGDTKRARVVLQEVVDRGGDEAALLTAARALALLFARARETRPLAAILERLSRIEPEPVERWAAVERLVKLSTDRGKVIAAWQDFAKHNGPSRELYAKLIPLLEHESRWQDLADVLAADAAMAPESERAAILGLLGELRLSRLEQPEAAFATWREALELDPQDRGARQALEQLLAEGPHRAAAAEVLEPVSRREGGGELVRVLVTRGEASPEPTERLSAFEEAVAILERDLAAPEHALDLASRALKQALEIEARAPAPRAVGKRAPLLRVGPAAIWLDRVERLAAATDPARRAAVLAEVLGDRPIDSPTTARLARLTGEAFEAAGDLARALGLYHRALASYRSSTELKVRVYSLMMKKAEETLGNRAAAVAHVSKHVLAVSPEQMDAAFAIALLLPEIDGLEGTLAALRDLERRSEGAVRTALELISAELLLDRLHRPDEALEILERVLAKDPNDPAALPILERALARPASRERAVTMLQRASDAAEDPARALAIVERLIAAPPLEAESASQRRAWFDALIERYAARPEVALGIAVRAVAELPEEDAIWERAERLARLLNRPDPVLETFKSVLDAPLEAAIAAKVGRRAVDFHEEWFEDEDGAIGLLVKMLPVDPAWAFDRLKLAYSSSGRWSDLFTLYDRRIDQAEDASTREKLLEEAAQVAKDFANDAERAIVYLERLAQVRRADGRIDAALERLYERRGKSRELIDLLSARLPQLSGDEAQQLRVRIAGLWLDSGDEAEAFQRIEQMLEAEPNRAEAFQLLERIVLAPPASDINAPTEEIPSAKRRLPLRELQRGAAVLKDRYTAEGRTKDLVRVTTVELDTETTDDGRIKRHRELALLKLQLSDDAAAFEDVAALVMLETPVIDHRRQLADLADRLGMHQRLAEVLVAAAERCESAAAGWETTETSALAASLIRDAAIVHRDRLGKAPRAIELFTRAVELAKEEPSLVLSAARDVEPLLAAARRDLERCTVLETIALLERDPEARRTAFGQVARLAADVLGDEARAVNAWRARLLDDGSDREALDGLAAVLEKAKRWRELIDVLDRRATVTLETDPPRAKADRVYIAKIYLDELAAVDDGIEAWKRVRVSFGPEEENFLALAGLLEQKERWRDLAGLLEEEADAARDAERKVSLYRRLGDLWREKIVEPSAAARSYREALALDPRDLGSRTGVLSLLDVTEVRSAVIDGLARAYVETGDWERASELAGALGSGEDVPGAFARKYWWGVALYYRDDRSDPDAAEWALRRALSHDESNAEILTSLAAVQRRAPGRPLVDTLVRLSDVKGGDLDLLREAAEVGIRTLGDRAVGSQNCEKLLDLAVARWTASGRKEGGKKKRLSDVADDPRSPRSIAHWSLDELIRMATEDGDHGRVVSLLIRGAELPFDKAQTRRMRRDAATISAERLGDAEGAIRIYRSLFDEDPSDEVAAQEVDKFAALLDAGGLNADVVALWEQRAKTCADAGDSAASAGFWARAADLAEERLGDVDRAIADHRQGAQLAGAASLEALARIHGARGEHQAAADALQALCATASPATLPAATLRLAESYAAAGDHPTARKRLEETAAKLDSAPDDPARPVRARLAEIYRDEQAWDPLATLFTAEAERANSPEQKLGYLREAASLHLFRRSDPASSIPLLEQAIALAPDEAVLGLTLSETLCTVGRAAEAMRVMDAQIERYGTRKPKDRALSHYALARAAQSAGDRARALAELDVGAKIDGAHAGILHALGRLATSEGQLDRALRAYQALLLVRQPQEDSAAQQAYSRLLDLNRSPGEARDGDLTRAELLVELSRIAKQQGDQVRADEFMESAREAARENPQDAKRLEKALARG